MARTLKLLPVAVTAVLVWWLAGTVWRWPDELASIIFCDVGQGDAMLVIAGSAQLLIDGGPDQAVLACLERYMPPWDEVIELVVLTHPDLDHYGGLSSVLEEYQVSRLVTNHYRAGSADFSAFEQAVLREQQTGLRLHVPQVGQQLVMGPLTVTILTQHNVLSDQNSETRLSDVFWQDVPKGTDKNELSIGVIISIGRVRVLALGDAESKQEQALTQRGMIPDIDVLKVSHHGSKTSTKLAFLATSRPELAVISSGRNNHFGHPHPEVLKNLEQSGAAVLRTDLVGSVQLVTDGERVWRRPTHCSFILDC
ncbi:MAG: hypothetical protein COU69_04210 [Candidatus Pacebacteria bacterium CG10_big_fil_rev_8_21_14_0_10_56_10]|nr:MAG: hypothetical protein COU69_04210 [Candidatus Pacebacteria bacterium CG10_big_fil_rev_8_21_14_0_10_56_10]